MGKFLIEKSTLMQAAMVGSVVFGVGCSSGGGDSGSSGVNLHATPPGQLVVSDLANLQTLDSAPFEAYNTQTNGLATKIFGGVGSRDILNYLNTRVSYFAVASELQVSPGAFGPSDIGRLLGQLASTSDAQVIALNVGAQLWIEGLAENTPVTFTVKGQVSEPVMVNSSRTGLVILADGYTDKALADDGSIVTIPPLFRQTVLMHEARHSDCTGGLNEEDLPNIRAAIQAQDGSALHSALHGCSHSHVICPTGHSYEGLPACDMESWGAYKVGAVFAEAYIANMNEDDRMWEIGQAIATDSNDRLLVDVVGTPDMSSAGLKGKK